MISKYTVAGNYPVKFLGDIVDFLDNQRKPVKESERCSGLYPYYGANGQQGTIDKYLFDEPLVLLAEDGGFFDKPDRGIAYRVSGRTWVNNHAHVLRPRFGLDIDFLYRVLQNYDVRPFITGTTRGKLTKGAASNIPIPLPPLDEQRRIAMILDQVDALRQMRRQALEQLDTLTQSIFLEMFGDPVTNPKGWDIQILSDVGVLDRGVSKHRPRNAPELLGGKYPLIQTGDVANCDRYIRSYTTTYSEVGLRQSKIWSAGTLCITIAANIAKTGILTFNACFPDSIVGFKPNDLSSIEYVQCWLSFLQPILEASAPESAQKNINLAILRNLRIPIPPYSLQQEFARRVEAIEQLKATHGESLAQLDALFSSLQHRAFRGEL